MPVSEKQLSANRANAKKSTGPKTEAGKAKVAANAIKHGVTARSNIVLPGEQEAYDALSLHLRAEAQPFGALELDAFQQLLQAAWQLRRTDAFEAALHHPRAGAEKNLQQLERLTRLRGALERSYQRAYRRLRELQATRAAEETLSFPQQLAHCLATPLAPLAKQRKQTHPLPETLPAQCLRAFSDPATHRLFPARALQTVSRILLGGPNAPATFPISREEVA